MGRLRWPSGEAGAGGACAPGLPLSPGCCTRGRRSVIMCHRCMCFSSARGDLQPRPPATGCVLHSARPEDPPRHSFGMGLSPDAGRKGPLCPSRFPRFGPKPTSRTAEESLGFQVLVQLSPKQVPLEPGEKPGVNAEPSPRQRRTESSLALKSESASQAAQQAAEGNPRPRPGDLIEIFRVGYEHWAICVEDDRVVHLAPPSEEFMAGSITSIFSNRAVVKCSRLEDVLHGCSWKVNNKLDGTYLPLPVDKILQRTRNMINKIVQYSLIDGNCEHFVNDLRYGVPRSQQVEQALMQGAKAAGAMLSAVVGSIRPKAVTASSDSGHHAEEEPGRQQRERPPFVPLASLLSGPV